MQTFAWQGREIAWKRLGSGPPVVFCHGTPFSSVLWEPFAASLARDFTVHLWDMPGYGRSSKHPDHPVHFGAQAEALAALLEHWGLERPHVVAHDFGGAVSLRAHLVLGAAYASLMLVDVVAIPPSGSPFFRFVKENPDVLGELPGYIHEAIVRRYIQGASHRGLRDDDLDALVRPGSATRASAASTARSPTTTSGTSPRTRNGSTGSPSRCRVLWGKDDAWLAPAVGERLAGLIPGADLTLVDGAGHLMHYDAPVALADAIRSWLEMVRE